MIQKYTYCAYGLRVTSDFPLPELQELKYDGNPEVIIRMGSVPNALEEPIEKGARFEASPDKFLLKVDKIAGYYVSGGNEIIVEPFEGADEEDIRVFLLGSAFAALLDPERVSCTSWFLY